MRSYTVIHTGFFPANQAFDLAVEEHPQWNRTFDFFEQIVTRISTGMVLRLKAAFVFLVWLELCSLIFDIRIE